MESVSPYTTRAFHLLLASTIRMAFSKVCLADCTTYSIQWHQHNTCSVNTDMYQPVIASVHMGSMYSKIPAPINKCRNSVQQSCVRQGFIGSARQ